VELPNRRRPLTNRGEGLRQIEARFWIVRFQLHGTPKGYHGVSLLSCKDQRDPEVVVPSRTVRLQLDSASKRHGGILWPSCLHQRLTKGRMHIGTVGLQLACAL
jgi:hypothetical protein